MKSVYVQDTVMVSVVDEPAGSGIVGVVEYVMVVVRLPLAAAVAARGIG